jgi:hypothetical protein
MSSQIVSSLYIFKLEVRKHFSCYAKSRPSGPPLFDCPNNIWWRAQSMKCLIHYVTVFIPFYFVGRYRDETVRWSNPAGCKIFRTRPDRSWGPPSLLYNGYRGSSSGVKRPGCCINHPPPSSVEVKERVELYFYSSVPSWQVVGCTLSFLPLPDRLHAQVKRT